MDLELLPHSIITYDQNLKKLNDIEIDKNKHQTSFYISKEGLFIENKNNLDFKKEYSQDLIMNKLLIFFVISFLISSCTEATDFEKVEPFYLKKKLIFLNSNSLSQLTNLVDV